MQKQWGNANFVYRENFRKFKEEIAKPMIA